MKRVRSSTWTTTAKVICRWYRKKICKALLKLEIDEGLGGGASGAPASYIAMGHLYFNSVESFQTIFAPHADDIMADIPNYTDIEPSIQVSEVKI